MAAVQRWMSAFDVRETLQKALDAAGVAWADGPFADGCVRQRLGTRPRTSAEIDDRVGGTRRVTQSPYRFSDAVSGVVPRIAYRGEDNASALQRWLDLPAGEIERLAGDGRPPDGGAATGERAMSAVQVRSDGRTITESDILTFAGFTGDYCPLHVDEEYAKTTPYGTRILHGNAVLSIASGLLVRTGVFDGHLGMLGMEFRMTARVRPGDTIHAELRGALARRGTDSTGAREVVVYEPPVLDQQDRTVLAGRGHSCAPKGDQVMTTAGPAFTTRDQQRGTRTISIRGTAIEDLIGTLTSTEAACLVIKGSRPSVRERR